MCFIGRKDVSVNNYSLIYDVGSEIMVSSKMILIDTNESWPITIFILRFAAHTLLNEIY